MRPLIAALGISALLTVVTARAVEAVATERGGNSNDNDATSLSPRDTGPSTDAEKTAYAGWAFAGKGMQGEATALESVGPIRSKAIHQSGSFQSAIVSAGYTCRVYEEGACTAWPGTKFLEVGMFQGDFGFTAGCIICLEAKRMNDGTSENSNAVKRDERDTEPPTDGKNTEYAGWVDADELDRRTETRAVDNAPSLEECGQGYSEKNGQGFEVKLKTLDNQHGYFSQVLSVLLQPGCHCKFWSETLCQGPESEKLDGGLVGNLKESVKCFSCWYTQPT